MKRITRSRISDMVARNPKTRGIPGKLAIRHGQPRVHLLRQFRAGFDLQLLQRVLNRF